MPFTVDSIRRSMARETLSARRAGLPFPHDRIDRLRQFLNAPTVTLATVQALPAVPPMDDTQHALLAAYLHALIRAKEAQDPEEYEAAAREADRLWAMLRGDHAEQTATLASDPFAAPKWSEYHGPRGGRGWHNPETGQRRYNARDPNLPRASGRLDPDHPDAPYQKWMVPGEELTDDLRAEIDHHRANIGEVPPADARVEKYSEATHGPSPSGHAGYADVGGGRRLPVARVAPEEPKPAPPSAGPSRQEIYEQRLKHLNKTDPDAAVRMGKEAIDARYGKTGDPFTDHESGPQARPGAAPQPQPQPQPAPKSNDLRHNPLLDALFGIEPAPARSAAPKPLPTPSGGPPPARVDVPSGGGQPVAATPAGQQPPAPVPQAPAPQPSRTPAKVAPPEPPAAPQPRVSPEQYRAAAAESYQSRRQEEDRARVEWVRQHRPDLLHKLPGAPQPAPYISRTPARIHHDEEPVELEPAEAPQQPAVARTTPQQPAPAPTAPAPQPQAPFDPHAELADLGAKLERHAAGHLTPGLTDQLTRVATRMGVSEEDLLHQAAEAHHAAKGPPTTHPRDVTGQPAAPAAAPQDKTGLADMGAEIADAIGHNLRKSIADSIRQTGDVPTGERGAGGKTPTYTAQAWDRVKAAGLDKHPEAADRFVKAISQAYGRGQGGPEKMGPAILEALSDHFGDLAGKPQAAKTPARAYGHAHRLLRQQAQAAGLDPDEVQSVADQLLRDHNAQADQHNELLKFVRKHGGVDVIRRGKDKRVAGREDNVPGLDTVAQEAAGLFPAHFREPTAANGGEHHEQLQAMLEQGDKPRLTPEQAYQKAMEQAEEEAYHKRLKAETEGDGPQRHAGDDYVPFSTDARLFAVLSALPDEVTTFTFAGERWERIPPVEWSAMLSNDGWEPYRGPRGGIGWKNVATGRIVYTASQTAPGYARRQVQSSAKRALELSGRHAAHLRGTGEAHLSEAELHELADHVQALPVHTLRSLKNHVMGTWGNVRRRQDMVEALTGHVRGLVDRHQAMEQDYHRRNDGDSPDDEARFKKERIAGHMEDLTPSLRADRLAGWKQEQQAAGGQAPVPALPVAAPAPVPAAAPAPVPVPAPAPAPPTPEATPTGVAEPWPSQPADPPAGSESPDADDEQQAKADSTRSAFANTALGKGSAYMPFPVKEPAPFESKSTVGQTGPVEDVPVKSLVATQKDLDPEYMKELHGGAEPRTKGPPKVVRINDEHHIDDGHHRAAQEAHGGAETIKAEVFTHDPATKKTRPLKYTPVPEDVSDEEYDRQFEEAKQKAAAGLAKMAEKQKERAAKKAALKESAPVAQEAPPPPPAQAPAPEPAPPVAEAPAVKAEPPKADHLALARQYLRGGVIDAAEADKLRATYASLPDTDRTRFAEAMGVESAARSLPEVRDELVERKVREMAHRGEHGPEVKRNTGNPLFGKPGVGESQGLFDAASEEEPEETPEPEPEPARDDHRAALDRVRETKAALPKSIQNHDLRQLHAISGQGDTSPPAVKKLVSEHLGAIAAEKAARPGPSLPKPEAARANPPEAPPDPAPKPQAPARQADPPPPEPKAEAKPAVDPEALGKRLAVAHSDRMSDNPTTGRKGDREFDRLLEEIGKLPPDQRARAMAAAEPPKPAPKPKGTHVTRTNEYHHGNGSVTKTHFLSDDRHTVTEAGDRFHLHEQAGGKLGHKGEYGSLEEAMAGAGGKKAATTPPAAAKSAGFGTAGEGHPLAGMDRKSQSKRLADALDALSDGTADPLGIDEAGAPPGLDMAAFGKAAGEYAAKHFNEKAHGAYMHEAYKTLGEPFGLSKHDFLRAMTALHHRGDVRLSGWSQTPHEIPDPELTSQISNKLFYYVQPGDRPPSAGGGAAGIADRLKAHVAGLKGDAAEHTSGDPLLKELEGMSQADVFKALEAAGIEAIRPGDSKSELIRRARLRLTASARAQERNAV